MKFRASLLIFSFCMLVCLCSCDNTVDVPQPQTENKINVLNSGEMLLAVLDFAGGVVEVRARGLVWNPQQQTATIDVFLINASETPLQGPALLLLENIDPETVVLMNPDGLTPDNLPYKEFDEEFGEDRILSPGEVSEADTFTFYVSGHRAFSIEFRLDGASVLKGDISGVVFRDANQNGDRDAGEPGVEGVTVDLVFIDGGLMHGETTKTGSEGHYRFSNLDAGVYSVIMKVPADAEPTTGNPLVVTLLESEDGTVNDYDNADFGVYYEAVVEDWLLVYDFNDNEVPGWGGNAVLSIVDGALKLTAHEYAEWTYHIFDWELPGIYTKGTFEFEAKFGSYPSRIDFRGHSVTYLSDYNYGPVVYFVDGIVRVKTDEDHDAYATSGSYVTDRWYRIRIEFDNAPGSRGRYSLFMTDLESGGPEILIGEYDYYATLGRLADITQFSFVQFTLDQVSSASFYIDDVKLAVE